MVKRISCLASNERFQVQILVGLLQFRITKNQQHPWGVPECTRPCEGRRSGSIPGKDTFSSTKIASASEDDRSRAAELLVFIVPPSGGISG